MRKKNRIHLYKILYKSFEFSLLAPLNLHKEYWKKMKIDTTSEISNNDFEEYQKNAYILSKIKQEILNQLRLKEKDINMDCEVDE